MQTRQQLLQTLRDLGVKQPSKLYPKRDEWSLNTTPDDQLDRMRAHVYELQEFNSFQCRYGNEVK